MVAWSVRGENEPSVDDMVLRAGEEKVTIRVVDDLGERSLVSWEIQQDGGQLGASIRAGEAIDRDEAHLGEE